VEDDSSETTAASPTILVVEDDDAVRDTTVAILRQAGYVVEEGENGYIALVQLRSNPRIKVVLLDVHMPGLDGLSLLDQIDVPPPVILMTAWQRNAEIDARASKIFAYLRKPVKPTDLLDVVEWAVAASGGPTSSPR